MMTLFSCHRTNAASLNLIQNPSFEIPSVDPTIPLDWSKGGWGTNTRTFTYPVPGVDGVSAAKVQLTNYTNGDAKWYPQSVAITPGLTYLFSDAYQADVTSYVAAQFKMSDGTFTYLDVAQADPSPNSWQAVSANFVAPQNVVSVTMFHLIKQAGSLTIDSFSLAPLDQTHQFPQGLVSLTFDDGYADHYDTAAPILNAAGLQGTFYMIPGRIDQADSQSVNIFTSSGISTAPVTTTSAATWGDIVNGPALVTDPTQQTYRFVDTYTSTAPSTITVTYCSTGAGLHCPASKIQTDTVGTLTAGTNATAEFLFTLPKVGNNTVTPISLAQTLNAPGTLTVSNPVLTKYSNYMTSAETLAMQNQGHEMASHTEDHCNLVTLYNDPTAAMTSVGCPDFVLNAPSTAADQISLSKTSLAAIGIAPDDELAYPFGSYNAAIEQLVTTGGFTAARTVDVGYNDLSTNKLALKVQNLDATTSVATVKSWIDTAVANKVWLILVFHQIEDQATINQTGAIYAETPDTLQQIASYLKTNNVEVATVHNGVQIMNNATPPPPQNLIQNPTLLTPSANPALPLDWAKGGWGNNTRVFSYPVPGEDDDHAAEVQLTSYTNGDAKWYFQNVPVTPGQTYAFSDWYESDVTTYVAAQMLMNDGTYTYLDIAAAPPSATWQNVQTTFVVPPNVVSLTMFHIIKQVGYLTTDNFSLTSQGVIVPPNNLIANPSVEVVSPTDPTLPKNWKQGHWGANTTTFSYPVTGLDGSKAIQIDITAYTNGDAKWYFDPVTVTPGTTYSFSDTYVATTTSEVTAQFKLADGTTVYQTLAVLPASATATNVGFILTAPANAVSLTIFHLLASVGSLTTDNFSLTQ